MIFLDRLASIGSFDRDRTLPIQDDLDFGEDPLELKSSGGGGLCRSSRWSEGFVCASLTFLQVVIEDLGLLCDRPNQCGNPCLRLKPPGARRSSSVALTVSELEDPVVYV